MMMMNTEFHDWNAAHTYTEIEKINWLLNAIRTLEEKLKLAYNNNNILHSIIKQQQEKANERTPVHLQKEAEAYKHHIVVLNKEITHIRSAYQEVQARLAAIFNLVTGR